MHFMMWRKRVADLDLDKVEKMAFRLGLRLVKLRKEKQWLEAENPSIAELGEQINCVIPCLDPDVATKKMISDEELSQRYFSDRDIFNEELDFDQE